MTLSPEQKFDPNALPFFRREIAYSGTADQDFYQFAVEVAADEVFLMKSDSQIIYANAAACEHLGYLHEELIGKYVWEWDPLFPEEAWPGFWQEFIEAKHLHFETQHRTKLGVTFPVDIHAHLYEREGQSYLLALVNDLTEKKHNEKLIYQQANFDHLTGLPNRYLLMDRLQQSVLSAKRSQQTVALLFLDLDNFKVVNDSLGHHIGDQLLFETARRIKNNVREVDTVARLGGDEFVIILEEVPTENIIAIADKLCHAISYPYQLSGHDCEITTSIGIAIYQDDLDNYDELLIQADKAMYAAKQEGRNQYRFYTESLTDKPSKP